MKQIVLTIYTLSFIGIFNNTVLSGILGEIAQSYPDVSKIWIQMLITLPAIVIIPSLFMANNLAERYTPKRVLQFGLGIMTINGLITTIEMPFAFLLINRLIFGIGVGLMMPFTNYFITKYIKPENHSKLFSRSIAIRTLGGILAGLVAGILALSNWHNAFYLYLIVALTLLLVTMFIPNEKSVHQQKVKLKYKDVLNPPVLKLLFMQMMIMVSLFIFITQISIYLVQTNIAPAAMASIALTTMNIASMVVSNFYYHLERSLKARMIYLTFPIYACAFLLANHAELMSGIILAAVVMGIAQGFASPYVAQQGVKYLAEPSHSLVFFSMMNISVYIGQFCTPFIISLMIMTLHLDQVHGPFTVGIIITLGMLIYSIYFVKTQGKFD